MFVKENQDKKNDLWCNMLQTLIGQKKYEEQMSDEQLRSCDTEEIEAIVV